jgi:hypothetical protein
MMTKQSVLRKIEREGVDYLKDCDEVIVSDSTPDVPEIAHALSEHGAEILYEGVYTGPGPSTTKMAEQAGITINAARRQPYDKSNRVTFRENNNRRNRLSLTVQPLSVEENLTNLYEISCSYSSGLPDSMIYLASEELSTSLPNR